MSIANFQNFELEADILSIDAILPNNYLVDDPIIPFLKKKTFFRLRSVGAALLVVVALSLKYIVKFNGINIINLH